MTIRERYGLSFSKSQSAFDGSTIYICKKIGAVDQYNTLQVIQQLIDVEVKALIDEIDSALNGVYSACGRCYHRTTFVHGRPV